MDSEVTGEYGGPDDPHVRFWNEWNRDWRFRGDLDEFMERQRDIATSVAQNACLKNARILDVGCGTGWLANALLPFGQAWGTDLSPEAIEDGRRRHPDCTFCAGLSRTRSRRPFPVSRQLGFAGANARPRGLRRCGSPRYR